MKTITYQIAFFSYWHASSGLAGSTYADLLVNKTREGLPYIPGKTLKGLLRDAAESIRLLGSGLISDAFVVDVFGQHPKKDEKGNEIESPTLEGKAFFTNATLSANLSSNIQAYEKKFLFDVLASTAINEKGTAKEGSLRQLEVTVPLTLYASIEQFPAVDGYEQQLEYCLQWIKRMGMNRSRGLGRCEFSIYPNR
jgi:CRISPR/Cas system CSM-associated protein Csm3 (group 7 of RAMP superfamily)